MKSPLLTLVCVSFPMYLSFPLLLKQDVIFIRKGQLSMYHQRIFMYIPRIKLTWAHHMALCINSFAKCISVFSRHHPRFSSKSLKKKMFIVLGSLAWQETVLPAVSSSLPLRWWCVPRTMFTTWTALHVSFVIRGTQIPFCLLKNGKSLFSGYLTDGNDISTLYLKQLLSAFLFSANVHSVPETNHWGERSQNSIST